MKWYKISQELPNYYNPRTAENPNTPPEILAEILRRGRDDEVSRRAANNLNTPPEALSEILRRGKSDDVSQYAASNPNTPPEVLSEVLRRGLNDDVSWYAALNPNTPPEVLSEVLRRGKNDLVSQYAAQNKNTPPEIVKIWLVLINKSIDFNKYLNSLIRVNDINKIINTLKYIDLNRIDETIVENYENYIDVAFKNPDTRNKLLTNLPKEFFDKIAMTKENRKIVEEYYNKTGKITNIPSFENVFAKKMKWYKKSQNQKILYIMRGIAGSGKSTVAKQLGTGGIILGSDDFFMIGKEYKFDRDKLNEAHQWNQKRVLKAMEKGISPIVVDNTNLVASEAKPYVEIAKKYGYQVEIKEPNTPWKFDAEELAKRNTHGVPKEVIEDMIKRYEPYTVEDALNSEIKKEASIEITAEHDYDSAWDYDITKAPKNIQIFINSLLLRWQSDLFPKIDIENIKINFVEEKSLGNELGKYVNGTSSLPIILLDMGNIKNACKKYNVDIETGIETTILHELGHAIQEKRGIEDNEELAENFAHTYYNTGEINELV